MIRISIGDNDFLFLMSRISEYLCLVFPEYKNDENIYSKYGSDSELIKSIIIEFLNSAHTDERIKNYVIDNLDIDIISLKDVNDYDDNGDAFYIEYSESKYTYFVK